MTFTMCRGIPGSGKSTWAEAQVSDTVVEVNSDNIRRLLGIDNHVSFTPAEQLRVEKERDKQILNALHQGKSVISSDMNLNPRLQEYFSRIAKRYEAEFVVRDFDTSVDECVRRDSLRQRPVGEVVIRTWAKIWRRE